MKTKNENTVLTNNLRKVVEEYSGYKVKKILVCSDPQVPGTYAIRTSHQIEKTEEQFDWLIVRYNPNSSVEENSHKLEECEFKSWPPRSGNLQFSLFPTSW